METVIPLNDAVSGVPNFEPKRVVFYVIFHHLFVVQPSWIWLEALLYSWEDSGVIPNLGFLHKISRRLGPWITLFINRSLVSEKIKTVQVYSLFVSGIFFPHSLFWILLYLYHSLPLLTFNILLQPRPFGSLTTVHDSLQYQRRSLTNHSSCRRMRTVFFLLAWFILIISSLVFLPSIIIFPLPSFPEEDEERLVS